MVDRLRSAIPIACSSKSALLLIHSGSLPGFRFRSLSARPIGRGFVRLRAHWNSRVKVPDLADTAGPVTESNCTGAITPGGEQLEVNHQSVTSCSREGAESELDSVGGSGELASERRSPNEIVRPALREWNASGREPQMVGDRMVESSDDVNQGTTAGGDKRVCRGQSVRSSEEAGNDRGAKGRRKAVPEGERRPSREGRRSAARLSASVWRRTAWPTPGHWQWASAGRRPIDVC